MTKFLTLFSLKNKQEKSLNYYLRVPWERKINNCDKKAIYFLIVFRLGSWKWQNLEQHLFG
jgi:hypothetical protein